TAEGNGRSEMVPSNEEEPASDSPSRVGPWKATAVASSWRARRARDAPSAWCFLRQRPSRHQGVQCLAMFAVGDTGTMAWMGGIAHKESEGCTCRGIF